MPAPLGTPYSEGSKERFDTRLVVQVAPPSALVAYVTSTWALPLYERSSNMTSSRPPGAAEISAPKRSPGPGAITTGTDQCVGSDAAAHVKYTSARPEGPISE